MKNNKNVGDIRIGAFINWPILTYDLGIKRASNWERPLLEKDSKPKALRKVEKVVVNRRGSKHVI